MCALGTIRTAEERDRDAKRLAAINAALDAIWNGDYGICVDCDAEIKPKRLAAVPWARRCLRCEEVEEAAVKERRESETAHWLEHREPIRRVGLWGREEFSWG